MDFLMIFVTLGTQDKPFERVLVKLDELIDKGVITSDIVVQAGSTRYSSKNMEVLGFIDMNQFNDYVENCEYMITHAGVGTIMNGINHGKKVVAVARRAQYGEHENDHQVEITEKFEKLGYIVGCINVDDLEEKIGLLDDFEVKQYKSNNIDFCNRLEELIDN
jgi:UDP-N-acetylglucosamine transferase subunit ALG13